MNLARAVRGALDLDTHGDHIELLKIPEEELVNLTELVYSYDSDDPLSKHA